MIYVAFKNYTLLNHTYNFVKNLLSYVYIIIKDNLYRNQYFEMIFNIYFISRAPVVTKYMYADFATMKMNRIILTEKTLKKSFVHHVTLNKIFKNNVKIVT